MARQIWRKARLQPAGGAARATRRPRGRWWSVALLGLAAAVGLGFALRPAPALSALPAPTFTLPVASGGHGMLSLRTLRGHPVLLNFFNTQCDACIAELPTLRRAFRDYSKHNVVVLGVATGGDTVDTARQFAADAHLSYPIVADTHQDVAWRYLVAGWPTTFFLDAQGRVRGQFTGAMDAATVRNGLAQAGAIACSGCATVENPPLNAPASSAMAENALTAQSADFVFSPPRPAPAFTLRDQQGRVITPASLRGRVVALTFVSAVCKGQCPLVGQTLSEVRRQLGRDASRLSIVAVSVAPEQDTPADIHAFARESGWLGTDWHYLTAPRPVLKRVWASYYVDVPPPPPVFKAAQDPVHQAIVFLIDPRGRQRAFFDVPFLAPRVAASVRVLLNGH